MRVQNDILKAIDNNISVILLLLDLSATFDTVDHSILLLLRGSFYSYVSLFNSNIHRYSRRVTIWTSSIPATLSGHLYRHH